MATLLDNLTDNIKTWTNTAASRASEITKAAATKAEELSRTGRLKMDVYQLERQQQRYLADLGRVAFRLIKKDTAPDALAKGTGVEKLMTRLNDLDTKIKSLEKEIEAASNMDATVSKKETATAKSDEIPVLSGKVTAEKETKSPKKASPVKKVTASKKVASPKKATKSRAKAAPKAKVAKAKAKAKSSTTKKATKDKPDA